jgi:DNA-directed RNA polymerase subunit RPC12/RpoP
MYCYHCGKIIDEHKLEAKESSFKDLTVNEDTSVSYVCPRCGHLTHANINEKELKELSIASHAQIQRGNNHFAIGMSCNLIGAILLIIALIFFWLAHKPAEGFMPNSGEFYVFVGLGVVSVVLLVYGIINTVIGLMKKTHYSKLLKDINNKTFVQ